MARFENYKALQDRIQSCNYPEGFYSSETGKRIQEHMLYMQHYLDAIKTANVNHIFTEKQFDIKYKEVIDLLYTITND